MAARESPTPVTTIKTLEQYFLDWERDVFGYGYGTGERHVLPALKTFFDTIESNTSCGYSYDYKKLEFTLGGAVTWLLISTLCHDDVITYGSSPRFAWLTPHGVALANFVRSKSVMELFEVISEEPNDGSRCGKTFCNCGPNGYLKYAKCPNPFWHPTMSRGPDAPDVQMVPISDLKENQTKRQNRRNKTR
jgi:hypothetical protein